MARESGMTCVHRYLLALTCFLCLRIIISGEGTNDELTCVIKYKNWIVPDNLHVIWTSDALPTTTTEQNDLDIRVTWYTNSNEGSCTEPKLTSCTWLYSHGMNFDFPFHLNVNISSRSTNVTVFTKEWLVDPEYCKQPPTIDHVITEAQNSTCVTISWRYDPVTHCSDYEDKLYMISYWRQGHSELMTYNHDNTTLVTVCNDSRQICNLIPFTKYVFMVQVKFGWVGTPRGHFSGSKTARVTTPEDVPSGSPEMTSGCFSLVENRCDQDNVRVLRIYWKDVLDPLKHGIITGFIMDARPHDSLITSEETITSEIPGSSYSNVVSLSCKTVYTITLRARTAVGVSSVYSSINITEFNTDEVATIERVIPEIVNHTFQVYWRKVATTPGKYTSHTLKKVFWCFTRPVSHCQSPINWSAVPFNSSSAVVPVLNGSSPHHYRIGVSAGLGAIKWANCHYTNTPEPQAPSGLRLESDESLPDGSITVYWDNDPCESRLPGPYIHQYLIYSCKVQYRNDTNCLGPRSQHVVDGRSNSYLFSDLETHTVYMFYLQAVGRQDQLGPRTPYIYGHPTYHDSFWAMPGAIVGIVISSTIVLGCAIYGVCRCRTALSRRLRFGTEAIIPHMPDDYSILPEHTTSV